MSRSRNEICQSLWGLYGTEKEISEKSGNLEEAFAAKRVTSILRTVFAHELYHGAKLELNAAADNAATATVSLTSTQSRILLNTKKIMQISRLQFQPADEKAAKALKSLMGVEIENYGFSPDEKHEQVCMVQTDGMNRAMLTAKNPIAGMKEGDIVWVQEPFVNYGERSGKIWADMTLEEQVEAANASAIRNPSQMPKYLMARRAKVAKIGLNTDGRNVWIEVLYEEIERFEKSEADEKALREELGISEEDAKGEEAGEAKAETATGAVGEMVSDDEVGIQLDEQQLDTMHDEIAAQSSEDSAEGEIAQPPVDTIHEEELP